MTHLALYSPSFFFKMSTGSNADGASVGEKECKSNSGSSSHELSLRSDQERGTYAPGNDCSAEEEDENAQSWKWRRPPPKLWVHIYLHQRFQDYGLIAALIGQSGKHMRQIVEATWAKLRVRGRGSGHLEVDGKKEARVPLMVAVTIEKKYRPWFRIAVEMTLQRLLDLEEDHHKYCRENGLHSPTKGRLFSFGAICHDAQDLLEDLLIKFPHPSGIKNYRKGTSASLAQRESRAAAHRTDVQLQPNPNPLGQEHEMNPQHLQPRGEGQARPLMKEAEGGPCSKAAHEIVYVEEATRDLRTEHANAIERFLYAGDELDVEGME